MTIRTIAVKSLAVAALSASLLGITAGAASAEIHIGNGSCEAMDRAYNTSMQMFYAAIDAGDYKDASWWHGTAQMAANNLIKAGCW